MKSDKTHEEGATAPSSFGQHRMVMNVYDVSPCVECDDRGPTCHATCGDYILWRRQYEQKVQAKIKFNKEKTDRRYGWR